MEQIKPFDHGYDYESTRAPQGWQVIGYNHAMTQVLDYLKEITEFKPKNRFVDSVVLIKKIAATLTELGEICDGRKFDQQKVDILSGTKPDQ